MIQLVNKYMSNKYIEYDANYLLNTSVVKQHLTSISPWLKASSLTTPSSKRWQLTIISIRLSWYPWQAKDMVWFQNSTIHFMQKLATEYCLREVNLVVNAKNPTANYDCYPVTMVFMPLKNRPQIGIYWWCPRRFIATQPQNPCIIN